jgi:hypothetical protein
MENKIHVPNHQPTNQILFVTSPFSENTRSKIPINTGSQSSKTNKGGIRDNEQMCLPLEAFANQGNHQK